MPLAAIIDTCCSRFGAHVSDRAPALLATELEVPSDALAPLCRWLSHEAKLPYAGLIVEEREGWELRHLFHHGTKSGLLSLVVRQAKERPEFPSITEAVHAADWQEREAEDLFGVVFAGHPKLGDFVLHNEVWQEGLAPMRKHFTGRSPEPYRQQVPEWSPQGVLDAPGGFMMPIGPVFAAGHEPVHFRLETQGEEVIRTIPRLFYKYRAVEKQAEGRPPGDALHLAERFAGTCAFGHGWAYCRAVETVCGTVVPARAEALRLFFAELERLRHHAGAVQEICESTGLAVATAQAAMIEEELLRLCGDLTGHRYLYGLLAPGGLRRDFDSVGLLQAADQAAAILGRLDGLYGTLRYASSFLDRIEEVGTVTTAQAFEFGMAGPVARGSGLSQDLRRCLPYGAYPDFDFEVPAETEGDGFARLRVLVREARESAKLLQRLAERIMPGEVCAPVQPRSGAALGWTETPRGAAFHWVRLGGQDGIERYRILPPSFANWHGFHLAAERFAFQDFPIILATFSLSVAESDR